MRQDKLLIGSFRNRHRTQEVVVWGGDTHFLQLSLYKYINNLVMRKSSNNSKFSTVGKMMKLLPSTKKGQKNL